jgi:hypothetical protein
MGLGLGFVNLTNHQMPTSHAADLGSHARKTREEHVINSHFWQPAVDSTINFPYYNDPWIETRHRICLNWSQHAHHISQRFPCDTEFDSDLAASPSRHVLFQITLRGLRLVTMLDERNERLG